MDDLARTLLLKLLTAAEKSQAGRRQRPPALTAKDLKGYRSFTSLQKKDDFETTLRDAQIHDAVSVTWDNERDKSGFIKRVDLNDIQSLATFLHEELTSERVSTAKDKLDPWLSQYSVINEVLQRWGSLYKIRGLGPDSVQDWVDAIRTIEYCQVVTASQAINRPIREASARLFADSKRIEKLTVPLDTLLANSLEAEKRPPDAVWQELGLFREEQPVRLAGNVEIRRERVTACLDVPYTGLPADSVLQINSTPELVMTIENLTTFHSEARRLCNDNVLIIYTAGMPSPSWQAMYARLLMDLTKEIPIYHWGDVDEGGFRIAAKLSQIAKLSGHDLKPWKMSPSDIPVDARVKANQYVLEKIKKYAATAGWMKLGEEIAECGFTAEQEAL